MPELPEVETIVRGLRKKIVGLKIRDVWSDREKTVRQAGGLEHLKRSVKDHKILSVRRRAKFIIIDIEGPNTIFIHQKISGHLLYGKWRLADDQWQSMLRGPLKTDPKNKYIRVVFSLSNGHHIAFSDLRRFGKVMLVHDDKVADFKEITKLGPEPLEISYNDFRKLFAKKRGFVKPVLMDPYFIVGIGNIYADEILWFAGIHPLSRTEHLKERDIKNIYRFMKVILKRAIAMGGSSNDDYRLTSGEKGRYQNVQKAYHQTGKKCKKNDGGTMVKIKIGARSAHFCPKHQILI